MPVRNEAESLPTLWRTVQEQTYPIQELVIVDGGSTDGTTALARRLAEEDPRVRVLEVGPATPGHGRNCGISAAREDWIALTDSGIRLEPNWLEALVEVVRRQPDVGVVYGQVEPEVRGFLGRCAALAYMMERRPTPAGLMKGPSVASTLIHRSTWRAADGFPDLRSGEDLLFMSRIEALGIETGWAPAAVVRWELQPTLAGTFRRFRLYSRHSVEAGLQGTWHHPVARQYLVGLPAILLAATHSPWWASLPVAGAAARVARSIWRRREGRGLLWALNPVQFAGVGVVIATIDVAMFVGWAQAVLHARKHTGRPLAPEGRTADSERTVHPEAPAAVSSQAAWVRLQPPGPRKWGAN